MEDENEISLNVLLYTIVYSIARKWRMVTSLTIVGLIFGILISSASFFSNRDLRYTISGSFNVSSQMTNGTYTGNSKYPSTDDVRLSSDLVDSVIYAMKSKDMIKEALSSAGISDMNSDEIRDHLDLTQYNETSVVTYSFLCSDAKEGITFANALLAEAKKKLPDMLTIGSVETVESPSYSYKSLTLSSLYWILITTLLGFIIAIVCILIERVINPTLLNVDDITYRFDKDLIGVVPRDRRYFTNSDHLLDINDTNSQADQSFMSVSYALTNMLEKETGNIIYVTSTSRREGRTSIVAGLGTHLASMEKKVLLIDLDVKVPTLGGLFFDHITYEHSLNALYHNECEIEEAILHVKGYLDVLPTLAQSRIIRYDQTLFDLILSLKSQYDYILIDTEPVGTSASVLRLNDLTSDVLYVIGYDNVSLNDIENAFQRIEKGGIKLSGVLVNEAMNIKTALEKDQQAQRTYHHRPKRKTHRKRSESDEEWTSYLEFDDDTKVDPRDQAKADEQFGIQDEDEDKKEDTQ